MFHDRFGLGSSKGFRLAGPVDFGCTDTRPTPRLHHSQDVRLKCYRTESREVV